MSTDLLVGRAVAPQSEKRDRVVRSQTQVDALRPAWLVGAVNLPDDEQVFLRDLVRASRQRTLVVKWTDRDGTERHTALTATEATRVNTIAHRLGISKVELMRQAAHIPVAKTRSAGASADETKPLN